MHISKPTVLYVDDEQENLDGFEATFYNYYNIIIANSAKKGMEILSSKEIHIIISDQRMPEMTGLEFFQVVQKKFPDIICIILTAHLDLQAAVQAVNQGGIYRYMMKPWEANEMKMTIDNAMLAFQLKAENKALISELQKKNKELEEHRTNLQKLVEQKTEELNRKNKELEQLNQMKDKFFSSLLSKAKEKN